MTTYTQVYIALGDTELLSDLLMGESLRSQVNDLFRDVLLMAADW